jgi:hypothetical protein
MKKFFYCQLTLRERRGTPQPLQGRLLPLNVPMNQLLYSRSQTVFSLWKRFLGSLHTTESSKTRNYDSWIDTRALLYKGHVKTTPLQKLALAVGSALIAFYDPLRTDMVAILGETTGLLALRQMHEKMKRHPVGQLILTEKPRVNTSTVRMEHLNTLPEHTFGKAYYQFMKLHGFSPNERYAIIYIMLPQNDKMLPLTSFDIPRNRVSVNAQNLSREITYEQQRLCFGLWISARIEQISFAFQSGQHFAIFCV